MLRLALALLLASLLAGCYTRNFQVVEPDPTSGLYATHTVLKPADVRVAERFNPSHAQMIYLKLGPDSQSSLGEIFFVSALKDMHTFRRVVTDSDMQLLIAEHNMGSHFLNVSEPDLAGLHELSKKIGPFLILEPDLVADDYIYDGKLKVTDASTEQTVLLIDKRVVNITGLDGQLFHPMLNGFINWTRNQPIAPGMPVPR